MALDDNETAALRERVRDLEETLRQQDPELAIEFGLSPSSSNLLGLLLTLRVASTETIQQRLRISDAKVAIYRLRQDLKQFNIPINSRRHLGYWLTAEAKEAVHAHLKRGVTTQEPEVAHG